MRATWRSSGEARCIFALTNALIAMCCAGCSDSPPPPVNLESRSASGERSPSVQNPPPVAGASEKLPVKPDPKQLVRVDESGRKWFGDIPYDVWFDDPLAVAGDMSAPASKTPMPQPAAATTSIATNAEPTPSAPPAATTADASASRTVDWVQIAPVPVVEDETKSIRNRLTQSMQTVGAYNGAYKEIQADGATLAALAEIVIEHPTDISWKERAPVVRDLGAQVNDTAKALGREAYVATQKPFESLVTVLDGGKANDVSNPQPTVEFAERANRGGLMRRLNRSFTWLKQNVGKADDLTSQSAEAAHEASMIAILAAVIGHKSYDSSGEEAYRTQAGGMIEDALQLRKAVETLNFAEYQDSFNRVQKRCDQCHADYRFGNE